MCFQDLAIMRAMPNLHVYSPADVYELRAMMKRMVQDKQPTYMQLVRPKTEPVFDESVTFEPGKAVTVIEGNDVTLISTGYMTKFAKAVAEQLAGEGIGVELLHCPSVKPLDAEAVVASAQKTGGVVTVENQNILGGLGGAVCEVLCDRHPVPVKRLGVPDQFGEVASEEYLFEKHGFGPTHIADACRAMSKRNKA
jgi:transketolase